MLHGHGYPQPGRPTRRGTGTGIGSQLGEPALFVENQLHRHLTPRQPDHQVSPKAIEHIVPTRIDQPQGLLGQVRMLIA